MRRIGQHSSQKNPEAVSFSSQTFVDSCKKKRGCHMVVNMALPQLFFFKAVSASEGATIFPKMVNFLS